MQKFLSTLLVIGLLFSISAYAGNICDYQDKIQKMPLMNESGFRAFLYSGQQIDQILVSKNHRRIYLLKDQKVIRSYPAAFGQPRGAKRFEGDMKTPEGLYFINRKNPNSAYTLSLQISYPNKQDIEYARRYGKSPGGDIMVHGLPSDRGAYDYISTIHPKDWTLGCVAVNNSQIRETYHLTALKTPITICPMK